VLDGFFSCAADFESPIPKPLHGEPELSDRHSHYKKNSRQDRQFRRHRPKEHDVTENFIDKSPTRTKCLAYPAADQDPVARPSRGWPVQGIAQAIGAVAQGAARATMTTANGVRGQLRPSSIRFLASAVVTQTCLMGSVQGAELTAGVPSVATPQATQFGEVTVVTKGTIAYGTIIRADDRDSNWCRTAAAL
jgi:hypothetical protein